ncbi:MAG: coproporphyrinogen III oxidase, partial [Actinomycetota bacterium]
LYWRQGNYEGFGSAAHAHLSGRRWWNVRTPERYIELVNAGESPESASETLDARTRKREALQLLVRTREGVPLGSFSEADLDEMSELIQRRDDKIVLTIDGRLLANEVALRLIDAV